MEIFKLKSVLQEELTQLKERRRRLFGDESAEAFEKNKFGIAMSGGGIRSATINLGFLKTLNLFKILEKADYLSTVSGGGYTGAYIQATVKEKNGYDELFDERKINHLRMYGDYLIPGQGKLDKLWNTFLLVLGYVVSWIMSLLSPVVTVMMFYLLFKVVASVPFLQVQESLLDWNYENNKVMEYLSPGLWVLGGMVGLHFLGNLIFNFSLSISKFFTRIEAVLALVILLYLALVGVVTADTSGEWTGDEILWGVLGAAGLYAVGFFLNPNSLSFHRFYRKQLADAFLSHTGSAHKNLLLKDVFKIDGEQRGYLAPYPLINTCLNLQNPGGEDKFKGAKASDYFLLSPFFSGSKLSCYVKTPEFPGYKHMTLPAALTISAAAVNPGMGIYSSKLLSILMTLFNARLGFWVNNPLAKPRPLLPAWATYVVWWPSFFFKELFSKIGTDNRKLNISDGGHIENLAVYELLRRECRLILAVDAGADPGSTFADLENLSIRARNELGIDICFRTGQDPVDIIRPRASSGYAQKRFAIADLLKIWEEFDVKDEQGNQIFYKKTIRENGVTEEKEIKLEALVNYFYSKNDAKVLKFRVDLKAECDVDIPKEEFDKMKHMVIQSVKQKLDAMTGKEGREKIKMGTLVYVKSSVTPPRKLFVPEYTKDGEKNASFDTFKYKIYHPEFPHESTADQFFDPVQWESYFQLGQFIATDLLDTPKMPGEYQRGDRDIEVDELIELFDHGTSLFKKEERLIGLVDASAVPAAIADEADLEIAKPRGPAIVPAPAPEAKPVQEEIAEAMQFKI
jgi:hypothetical protein